MAHGLLFLQSRLYTARAQLLQHTGFLVATSGLSCPVAWGILVSQTRDQACVSCIGKQLLTWRSSLNLVFKKHLLWA